MEEKLSLEAIYTRSENVVARDIQGELIIIPLTSGVGDLEDEIFTLNETGRVIDGEDTREKGLANKTLMVYN